MYNIFTNNRNIDNKHASLMQALKKMWTLSKAVWVT